MDSSKTSQIPHSRTFFARLSPSTTEGPTMEETSPLASTSDINQELVHELNILNSQDTNDIPIASEASIERTLTEDDDDETDLATIDNDDEPSYSIGESIELTFTQDSEGLAPLFGQRPTLAGRDDLNTSMGNANEGEHKEPEEGDTAENTTDKIKLETSATKMGILDSDSASAPPLSSSLAIHDQRRGAEEEIAPDSTQEDETILKSTTSNPLLDVSVDETTLESRLRPSEPKTAASDMLNEISALIALPTSSNHSNGAATAAAASTFLATDESSVGVSTDKVHSSNVDGLKDSAATTTSPSQEDEMVFKIDDEEEDELEDDANNRIEPEEIVSTTESSKDSRKEQVQEETQEETLASSGNSEILMPEETVASREDLDTKIVSQGDKNVSDVKETRIQDTETSELLSMDDDNFYSADDDDDDDHHHLDDLESLEDLVTPTNKAAVESSGPTNALETQVRQNLFGEFSALMAFSPQPQPSSSQSESRKELTVQQHTYAHLVSTVQQHADDDDANDVNEPNDTRVPVESLEDTSPESVSTSNDPVVVAQSTDSSSLVPDEPIVEQAMSTSEVVAEEHKAMTKLPEALDPALDDSGESNKDLQDEPVVEQSSSREPNEDEHVDHPELPTMAETMKEESSSDFAAAKSTVSSPVVPGVPIVEQSLPSDDDLVRDESTINEIRDAGEEAQNEPAVEHVSAANPEKETEVQQESHQLLSATNKTMEASTNADDQVVDKSLEPQIDVSSPEPISSVPAVDPSSSLPVPESNDDVTQQVQPEKQVSEEVVEETAGRDASGDRPSISTEFPVVPTVEQAASPTTLMASASDAQPEALQAAATEVTAEEPTESDVSEFPSSVDKESYLATESMVEALSSSVLEPNDSDSLSETHEASNEAVEEPNDRDTEGDKTFPPVESLVEQPSLLPPDPHDEASLQAASRDVPDSEQPEPASSEIRDIGTDQPGERLVEPSLKGDLRLEDIQNLSATNEASANNFVTGIPVSTLEQSPPINDDELALEHHQDMSRPELLEPASNESRDTEQNDPVVVIEQSSPEDTNDDDKLQQRVHPPLSPSNETVKEDNPVASQIDVLSPKSISSVSTEPLPSSSAPEPNDDVAQEARPDIQVAKERVDPDIHAGRQSRSIATPVVPALEQSSTLTPFEPGAGDIRPEVATKEIMKEPHSSLPLDDDHPAGKGKILRDPKVVAEQASIPVLLSGELDALAAVDKSFPKAVLRADDGSLDLPSALSSGALPITVEASAALDDAVGSGGNVESSIHSHPTARDETMVRATDGVPKAEVNVESVHHEEPQVAVYFTPDASKNPQDMISPFTFETEQFVKDLTPVRLSENHDRSSVPPPPPTDTSPEPEAGSSVSIDSVQRPAPITRAESDDGTYDSLVTAKQEEDDEHAAPTVNLEEDSEYGDAHSQSNSLGEALPDGSLHGSHRSIHSASVHDPSELLFEVLESPSGEAISITPPLTIRKSMTGSLPEAPSLVPLAERKDEDDESVADLPLADSESEVYAEKEVPESNVEEAVVVPVEEAVHSGDSEEQIEPTGDTKGDGDATEPGVSVMNVTVDDAANSEVSDPPEPATKSRDLDVTASQSVSNDETRSGFLREDSSMPNHDVPAHETSHNTDNQLNTERLDESNLTPVRSNRQPGKVPLPSEHHQRRLAPPVFEEVEASTSDAMSRSEVDEESATSKQATITSPLSSPGQTSRSFVSPGSESSSSWEDLPVPTSVAASAPTLPKIPEHSAPAVGEPAGDCDLVAVVVEEAGVAMDMGAGSVSQGGGGERAANENVERQAEVVSEHDSSVAVDDEAANQLSAGIDVSSASPKNGDATLDEYVATVTEVPEKPHTGKETKEEGDDDAANPMFSGLMKRAKQRGGTHEAPAETPSVKEATVDPLVELTTADAISDIPSMKEMPSPPLQENLPELVAHDESVPSEPHAMADPMEDPMESSSLGVDVDREEAEDVPKNPLMAELAKKISRMTSTPMKLPSEETETNEPTPIPIAHESRHDTPRNPLMAELLKKTTKKESTPLVSPDPTVPSETSSGSKPDTPKSPLMAELLERSKKRGSTPAISPDVKSNRSATQSEEQQAEEGGKSTSPKHLEVVREPETPKNPLMAELLKKTKRKQALESRQSALSQGTTADTQASTSSHPNVDKSKAVEDTEAIADAEVSNPRESPSVLAGSTGDMSSVTNDNPAESETPRLKPLLPPIDVAADGENDEVLPLQVTIPPSATASPMSSIPPIPHSDGPPAPRPKKKLSEYIRRDLWNRGDPDGVLIALQAIADAAQKPEACSSIARTGGLLGIVRAMEDHMTNVLVQITGCLALERLALDPENEMAIADVGGIDAILGTMMCHFRNDQVHEAAWSALWNLTCLNSTEEMTIDSPGSMESLVSCMKQHMNQASVQKNACGALANLCLHNKERLDALAEAGGFVVISTALQTHWRNEAVKSQASYALTTLLEASASPADPDSDSSSSSEAD